MLSIKMGAIILCCFVLMALKHCCESVQCDQNGSTEAVHDPNSWYGCIAPMVPEGDEEMRGLLCDLDKVRPLVDEMANAKLDQEQLQYAEQSEDAVYKLVYDTQKLDEFEPKPTSSGSNHKSLLLMKKMNKSIRRISTGFKRATDGLAKWPILAQLYGSLHSGEFFGKIVAKNPKMAKIIPLMVECSQEIRSFSNEKVPKLMGQMQNLISQLAKLEGVVLANVQPMEIGTKKHSKSDILSVTKVLLKALFRAENSKGSKEASVWTVFRAWKTIIQMGYFAKFLPQNYGIKIVGNGHRRKKRMAIGVIIIGIFIVLLCIVWIPFRE